jgi:hypothetical protein
MAARTAAGLLKSAMFMELAGQSVNGMVPLCKNAWRHAALGMPEPSAGQWKPPSVKHLSARDTGEPGEPCAWTTAEEKTPNIKAPTTETKPYFLFIKILFHEI